MRDLAGGDLVDNAVAHRGAVALGVSRDADRAHTRHELIVVDDDIEISVSIDPLDIKHDDVVDEDGHFLACPDPHSLGGGGKKTPLCAD